MESITIVISPNLNANASDCRDSGYAMAECTRVQIDRAPFCERSPHRCAFHSKDCARVTLIGYRCNVTQVG